MKFINNSIYVILSCLSVPLLGIIGAFEGGLNFWLLGIFIIVAEIGGFYSVLSDVYDGEAVAAMNILFVYVFIISTAALMDTYTSEVYSMLLILGIGSVAFLVTASVLFHSCVKRQQILK